MADGREDDGGAEVGATAASASPASRHAPRLSFEAVVRISCAGRRGIHTGFVRDISRGGMFLRLVDPEPVGRRLGFELFLPGWRTPARGVGEVAWQRASYEGPGRPPGMAIRFVALEARAIEMLAAVLPGGEAPVVEVLEPRRLPPVRRDDAGERGTVAATAEAGAVGIPALSAAGTPAVESLLEELLAASGVAPASASGEMEPGLAAELGDGPMIFVPPPPLPEPELPPRPALRALGDPPPQPSRLRWGSAAAGIAAFGAIASLIVVGAARRDVLPQANLVATPPALQQEAARTASEVGLTVAPESLDLAAHSPGEAARPEHIEADAAQPASDTTGGAAAKPRATRIDGLRWEPLPGGGTRIVVELDGTLTPERLRVSRIAGDAPRLVVRLLGVDAVGRRAPWEPGTTEVHRVRAGWHDSDSGGDVHLVLDLAAPGVKLASAAVLGAELRLDLAAARLDR